MLLNGLLFLVDKCLCLKLVSKAQFKKINFYELYARLSSDLSLLHSLYPIVICLKTTADCGGSVSVSLCHCNHPPAATVSEFSLFPVPIGDDSRTIKLGNGLHKSPTSFGCLCLVSCQMDGLQMKTRKMKNPRIMFKPPMTRRRVWKIAKNFILFVCT